MPAIILAILAGLCWGVGEVCTKAVLHTKQIGPITAVTVRCVVALPVVLVVYLIAVHLLKLKHEPADWYRAEPRTLWTLVLGSGLCAGAAALLFFYAALNLGDISRIKPIAFTLAPATAVLLGKFVLGEEVSTRKWIAIALILGGVMLLT
ncbi:MAG: DMT family transporter, partial [Pyrinomonadaceae bacterium]|nr:DMT family transporter [Phycisphaerales bacterium]